MNHDTCSQLRLLADNWPVLAYKWKPTKNSVEKKGDVIEVAIVLCMKEHAMSAGLERRQCDVFCSGAAKFTMRWFLSCGLCVTALIHCDTLICLTLTTSQDHYSGHTWNKSRNPATRKICGKIAREDLSFWQDKVASHNW